jgi:hypothetical protein
VIVKSQYDISRWIDEQLQFEEATPEEIRLLASKAQRGREEMQELRAFIKDADWKLTLYMHQGGRFGDDEACPVYIADAGTGMLLTPR